MSFAHCGQVGVVVGDGVDDESVDSCLLDHSGSLHVVAFGTGGNEQQSLSCGLAGFGETGEEAHGGGVAEGVAEGFGEQ